MKDKVHKYYTLTINNGISFFDRLLRMGHREDGQESFSDRAIIYVTVFANVWH